MHRLLHLALIPALTSGLLQTIVRAPVGQVSSDMMTKDTMIPEEKEEEDADESETVGD